MSSILGGTLKAIRFLAMLPIPIYVATQYYTYSKDKQILSRRHSRKTPDLKRKGAVIREERF